jgi:hypothetical protein
MRPVSRESLNEASWSQAGYNSERQANAMQCPMNTNQANGTEGEAERTVRSKSEASICSLSRCSRRWSHVFNAFAGAPCYDPCLLACSVSHGGLRAQATWNPNTTLKFKTTGHRCDFVNVPSECIGITCSRTSRCVPASFVFPFAPCRDPGLLACGPLHGGHRKTKRETDMGRQSPCPIVVRIADDDSVAIWDVGYPFGRLPDRLPAAARPAAAGSKGLTCKWLEPNKPHP